MNNETLRGVLINVNETVLQINRTDILIACPIIVTFFTLIVIVIMLRVYIQRTTLRTDGLSSQTKAAILSLVFISVGKIFAFIGLDIGALVYGHKDLDSKVDDIYYCDTNLLDFHSVMFNVPIMLLLLDALAFFANIVIIIRAIVIKCTYQSDSCCGHWHNKKDYHYYCLALTVVSLIFSGLNHAPYIIMAYVSDANYASSIFVYYMVIIFIEFGVVQYTFSAYFDIMSRIGAKRHQHYGTLSYWLKLFINALCCIRSTAVRYALTAVFLSVSVNGIMIAIFIFFYFLPIKYVLSNAPSQAVLIYQSAVVLVGGYITYATVLKKHSGHQEQIMSECQFREINSEISYLEAELKHGKDIDEEKIKEKLIYAKKEIFHTSMKQKIVQLQSENDKQANHSKLSYLQNELIRVSKEIVSYMERCKQQIRQEDKPTMEVELNFLNEKIFYLDSDIIDVLLKKIWIFVFEPQHQAEVIALRRQMTISLQRKFEYLGEKFPDSLQLMELQDEVNAADMKIKYYLEDKPKHMAEVDDMRYAECITLNIGRLMQQYNMLLMKTTSADQFKYQCTQWLYCHQGNYIVNLEKVDDLRNKIVGLMDKRNNARQINHQPEGSAATEHREALDLLPWEEESDDLVATLIIERITCQDRKCRNLRSAENTEDLHQYLDYDIVILGANVDDSHTTVTKLEDEVIQWMDDFVAQMEERLTYQERKYTCLIQAIPEEDRLQSSVLLELDKRINDKIDELATQMKKVIEYQRRRYNHRECISESESGSINDSEVTTSDTTLAQLEDAIIHWMDKLGTLMKERVTYQEKKYVCIIQAIPEEDRPQSSVLIELDKRIDDMRDELAAQMKKIIEYKERIICHLERRNNPESGSVSASEQTAIFDKLFQLEGEVIDWMDDLAALMKERIVYQEKIHTQLIQKISIDRNQRQLCALVELEEKIDDMRQKAVTQIKGIIVKEQSRKYTSQCLVGRRKETIIELMNARIEYRRGKIQTADSETTKIQMLESEIQQFKKEIRELQE